MLVSTVCNVHISDKEHDHEAMAGHEKKFSKVHSPWRRILWPGISLPVLSVIWSDYISLVLAIQAYFVMFFFCRFHLQRLFRYCTRTRARWVSLSGFTLQWERHTGFMHSPEYGMLWIRLMETCMFSLPDPKKKINLKRWNIIISSHKVD